MYYILQSTVIKKILNIVVKKIVLEKIQLFPHFIKLYRFLSKLINRMKAYLPTRKL